MGILVYLKTLWDKPEPIDQGGKHDCAWNLADLSRESTDKKEKYQELLREAARLMVSRDYESCIQAYHVAAGEAKEDRHFCDIQIAQAYRLMGDPVKSMDFYWAACIHGAEPDQVDDHVWCLLQKTYEKKCVENYVLAKLLNRYLTHFPNGKYHAEAKQWMQTLMATQYV